MAAVIDLFSRRVVGWSMSAAMTAELVTDALVMAIWRRGRPRELLHHSDRGSQYTSEAFQRLMAEHGVTCSLSRSGNVWDNAAMESFFSSLKVERVARKIYRTRDQARADVFDYIERFYNPRRRHSTIGYLSPMQFEAKVTISLGWCLPNRQQLRQLLRQTRCVFARCLAGGIKTAPLGLKSHFTRLRRVYCEARKGAATYRGLLSAVGVAEPSFRKHRAGSTVSAGPSGRSALFLASRWPGALG